MDDILMNSGSSPRNQIKKLVSLGKPNGRFSRFTPQLIVWGSFVLTLIIIILLTQFTLRSSLQNTGIFADDKEFSLSQEEVDALTSRLDELSRNSGDFVVAFKYSSLFTSDVVFEQDITAPNVVYDINAGQGISITGDPQNPTISVETLPVSGVTAIEDISGDIDLEAGDNITITTEGNTIRISSKTFETSSAVILSESDVEAYIFDGDNTGVLESGTLGLDTLSYIGTLPSAVLAGEYTGITGVGTLGNLTVGGTATFGSGVVVGGDTISEFVGSGLTVISNTLSLNLDSGSGLEVSGSGLSLLRTCDPSEVLAWSGSQWECAAVSGVGGTINKTGTPESGYLTFWSGSNSISGENTLFYDTATNRLGIGNTTPTTILDVSGVITASGGFSTGGDTITDFTGTGLSNSGGALGLAASGVTAGTYGSTTNIPIITVDTYGRVTTISNQSISYDNYGLWVLSAGGNNTNITSGGTVSYTAGTGIGISNSSGAVTVYNSGVTSLAGTTNQITASAATGALTLSLPQNIHTGATVQFAGLTLGGDTITEFMGNGLTVASNTLSLHLASGSGLEFSSGAVSMLRSCNTNEVLSWNGSAWTCSSISGVGGITKTGSPSSGYLSYWSGTNSITGASALYTDGTNIGVGTTAPGQSLSVAGNLGIREGGVSPQYYTVFQGGDQSSDVTYTLPVGDGSTGYVLTTSGAGVLSWQSVTGGVVGAGDISAVGNITSGDAFTSGTPGSSLYFSTEGFAGLGAAAGRIQFIDSSTDIIGLMGANVGIGTTNPGYALDVNGAVGIGTTAVISGGISLSTDYLTDFTGTGLSNSGGALGLATSGVTSGTYGSSGNVPVISVDAYGRINNISTAVIAGGFSNWLLDAGGNVTTVNSGSTVSFTSSTGIGISNSSGAITLYNSGVTSLAGTSNQITANASTGAVTLSLPQSIHTGATVQFTGLTLGGDTITEFMGNGLTVSGNTLSLRLAANSGLEFLGGEVTMLQTCNLNEVLSWDGAGWGCSSVTGVGGITKTGLPANGYLTYWTGTNSITGTSALYTDGTGIGIGTTTPGYSLDVSGAVGIGTTAVIGGGISLNGDYVTDMTGSGLGISSGALINTGVTYVTGTTNQVNVSANTGALTLSLPQNIHTGATVQFTGLTLGGDTITEFMGNGLTVSGNTLAINLATGSGLEFSSGQLSMLRSCNTNEVLSWTGAAWACSTISGVGGITKTGSPAAGFLTYWSATNSITGVSALYTDGTNIGIGTTAPGYALDVSGSVGIGTTAVIGGGISLNGDYVTDLTGTGLSNAGGNLGLSTSGVTAGTYGSTGEVPVITVDAFGRITNVVNATIAGGFSNWLLNASGTTTTVNSGSTVSFVSSTGIGLSHSAGTVTFYNSGVTSLAGTTNQITASAATGAVTLSLPQNIHTGATVQFAQLGIGQTASNIGLNVASTAWLRGSTANSGGLFVNSSGNVGIGKTNPSYALDVSGAVGIGTTAVIGGGISLNSDYITDLTGTGLSNAGGALGLSTTGVTSGTYGSGSESAVISVDAFGRINSISTASIPGGYANWLLNAGGNVTTINSGTTVSFTPSTGIGVSNSSGSVTLYNTGVTSLAGTTNQITASASTGAITLSLPQSIHTGATVQFTGLTLGGDTITEFMGNGLTVSSNTLSLRLASGSGLEFSSGAVSMLRSCGTNEVLSWNGSAWVCSTITGVGGITKTGTPAAGYLSYWSGANSVTGENALFTDGTNLGIGTTAPGYRLDVNGSVRIGTTAVISGGISLNGDYVTDLTGTGLSNAGGNLGLSTSGVTAGTYGSTGNVPVITVDAYGRITNVTHAAIAGGYQNWILSAGGSATTIISGNTVAFTGSTGIGISNTSGSVTLYNSGVTSLAGTTNQITASAATGAVTLSLPQNIHTGATVQFAQLGIGQTAGNIGLNVAGTTWLRGSTANSGGLFVNSSGNVGIGKTNPSYALDVSGAVGIGTTAIISGGISIGGDYLTDLVGTGLSNAGGNLGLSTTGVVAGTYGSTTTIPIISVDAYGRINSVSNSAVTGLYNSWVLSAGGNVTNITTGSTVSFTGSTGIGITNTAGSINIVNSGVTSLSGTPNQVNVSASTGAVTLSLPQNIHTGATVAFSTLSVGTTAADARLHIVGGDAYIAPDSGYTFNNPSSREDLYVYGNLEVDGSTFLTNLYLGGTAVTSNGLELNYLDGTTVINGGVMFGNGTNIAQDAANLFWNDSTNRLGIGTTAPTSALEILATSEQLRLSYDGSNYMSFTIDSTGKLSLSDSGTQVATFSDAGNTFDVPTSFTAAGDVSFAYDAIFTNGTSGNIVFEGPGSVRTSHPSGNYDLTLSAANAGQVVVEDGLKINSADPTLVFDTLSGGDTDYWMGVWEDGAGDDDDLFVIGDGLVSGTNPFIALTTAGNVGIGTTNPSARLDVNGSVRVGTTAVIAGGISLSGDYITDLTGSGLGVSSGALINTGVTYVTGTTNQVNVSANTGAVTFSLPQNIHTGATVQFAQIGIGQTASNIGLNVASTAWLRGSTANSGGLFVNSSGNVGIGTTAPSGLFQVGVGVTPALVATSGGNVGIGISSPSTSYKLDILSSNTNGILNLTGNSITSGTGVNLSLNGLSTGTGFNIASTSTALTSGRLMNLDWSPSGTATATGDLFRLNIGPNGTLTGNLLALYNNGSDVFKVSTSKITSAVPHEFTAAGDVSIANDLIFTDQISNNIQSYGPLTIESGEVFENQNLTLRTFGTGSTVFELGGSNKSVYFDGSTGNVGIGMTSPLTSLHVYRDSNGAPVRFQDTDGYCEINPTSTTWSCTSDARLKKDVSNLSSAAVLEKLTKLQGVSFKWKTQKDDDLRYGFIAQQVEGVFPELVQTGADGLKTVSYGGFTPYLVEALKAQDESFSQFQLNTTGEITDIQTQLQEIDQSVVTATEFDGLQGDVEVLKAKYDDLSESMDEMLEKVDVNAVSSLVTTVQELALRAQLADDKMASLSARITFLEDQLLASSDSAVLGAQSDNILATSSAVLSSLAVTGETNLYDLGISGTITAGLLTINGFDDSLSEPAVTINSIGGPLKIQSLGLESVDFMDGKVSIDPQGNMKVLGKLVADVVRTKKLEIIEPAEANESGVETEGNPSTQSKSIGESKLLAGESEILIETPSVTNDSKIYVTFNGEYSPATRYWIDSKLKGKSFTIKLDAAVEEDVDFSWLIVN